MLSGRAKVVRRSRHAFTLVELLVVIGIIAVLVGILLPALGRARSQAQTVACLANLRSIGQAIGIYAVNNKGSLPYGYWDNVGSPDGNEVNSSTYTAYFSNGAAPNSSDWALLLMSNALGRGGATQGTQQQDTASLQQMFICPTANADIRSTLRTTTRRLHYSSHPRLMPRLDDKDGAKSTGSVTVYMTPYRMASIRRAGEIAMIWDGPQMFQTLDGNAPPVATGLDQDGVYRGDNSDPNNHGPWNFLLQSSTVKMNWAPFASNQDNGGNGEIRWRHGKNDTANFLFADGHCDSIRLKKNVNSDLKLRNLYVNPK